MLKRYIRQRIYLFETLFLNSIDKLEWTINVCAGLDGIHILCVNVLTINIIARHLFLSDKV